MTKSVSASADVAAIRVGVHEAKTRLSELLRVVDSGAEVLILRNGDPVARLVPAKERNVRHFGYDAGRFTIPHDFDSTLSEDLVAAFEGKYSADGVEAG